MVDTRSTSNLLDEYPNRQRSAFILLSLALGTFLFAIDTTIIAVAVPRISSEFRTLDQIGWYGSAYLLVITAFQPILGNVYKFFAPKSVYLVSVVIFEGKCPPPNDPVPRPERPAERLLPVGSTICAASSSSALFILGRAVAGVGAAGLIQGALAIVTFMSTLEQRPMNLAIVVSTIAVAVPLGPVLGGIITDHIGWRWCFWMLGFPSTGQFRTLRLAIEIFRLASSWVYWR